MYKIFVKFYLASFVRLSVNNKAFWIFWYFLSVRRLGFKWKFLSKNKVKNLSRIKLKLTIFASINRTKLQSLLRAFVIDEITQCNIFYSFFNADVCAIDWWNFFSLFSRFTHLDPHSVLRVNFCHFLMSCIA